MEKDSASLVFASLGFDTLDGFTATPVPPDGSDSRKRCLIEEYHLQTSMALIMSNMATLLQRFAEEPALQNPTSDTAWKGNRDGISVKVYAPLSCKNLRQTCGVSDKALIDSFSYTASTAAIVSEQHRSSDSVQCPWIGCRNSKPPPDVSLLGQPGRPVTPKRLKWGVFKEKDQILLAPAGPYAARTISQKECKYLTRSASRYVEHLQDCQTSLLPRFYFILRLNKGGRVKRTKHWVVTDNLNAMPLPVRLTYDLKGVSSRLTIVARFIA